MDYRLKQRRASFSDPQSQKHVADDEHVAAVAAAAFSIHSLEEVGLRNLQKMEESPKFPKSKTVRGKEGEIPKPPSHGEISKKRSFGQELARSREGVFLAKRPSGVSSPTPKPISPAAEYQNHKVNPIIERKNDKAIAWEKAKIEKIQKRYEKMKSRILAWENERKMQAKMQMERKKSVTLRARVGTCLFQNLKLRPRFKSNQISFTLLDAQYW
ncbi:unnamed protein product [Sphenostylis stenocarpa]|uniref:Remorin C-terminal domain-containing protein n=1 Tax=Sphenostylis stenocarpa TaxID=92480 RepID=A0AA86VU24_9FABA|nr:unnamed protein product [Sphenostylis stenocarpa]